VSSLRALAPALLALALLAGTSAALKAAARKA